jgi:hypothetical protein
MKKIKFLVAALIAFSGSVFAEQEMYPRMGVIASSNEIASINYSCSKPKDDKINYRTIECEIHYQTLKKIGSVKVQKAAVEEEFKKKGIPSELCTMFGKKNIVDMTLAQVQAEASKQDETRNSFNRDMIAEMTPVLQKMCKEKTLDSFFKFVDFSSGIEENTCEIESGKTKDLFTELPQRKGERSLWISEDAPLPPCGKKAVIKFIPSKNDRWVVQYENVVLNKQAKKEDGQMCKDVDGVRNVFNSSNSTWNLPCKYIKLANKGAWQGPFNPK